jgi:hypothetical protein
VGGDFAAGTGFEEAEEGGLYAIGPSVFAEVVEDEDVGVVPGAEPAAGVGAVFFVEFSGGGPLEGVGGTPSEAVICGDGAASDEGEDALMS